jgi:DNA-binding MarR family transcriptional regulator
VAGQTRAGHTRAGRSEVVDELIRTAPRAVADTVLFQQAVADRLGLNLTDVKCLGPLADGRPSTIGEIAERLGLTPGAVTRTIDRLEAAGYVRRDPDPTDRRKILIVGVPERMREVTGLYDGMAQAWRDLLSGCTTAELEFLRGLLRHMREITTVEIAKLRHH